MADFEFSDAVSGVPTLSLPMSAVVGAYDTVTAFIVCYDQFGMPEEGVEVQLVAHSPLWCDGSPPGIAIDGLPRVEVSNVVGLVEFTNVIPGFSYRVRRGGSRQYTVNIPADATSPFPLSSIIGVD